MLRTLKNLFKQDREKFVVPKSVQNVICLLYTSPSPRD